MQTHFPGINSTWGMTQNDISNYQGKKVAAIVVFTATGRSAQLLATQRPFFSHKISKDTEVGCTCQAHLVQSRNRVLERDLFTPVWVYLIYWYIYIYCILFEYIRVHDWDFFLWSLMPLSLVVYYKNNWITHSAVDESGAVVRGWGAGLITQGSWWL